jgi:LysM repeat protein
MNGLHDLLEKLKKLEEAAAAPTEFKPNYYHKSNFGTTTPLMMTDPGVFWYMGTATNDEGGARRGGGGGRTIQRWYGNTESRDALSPASVDGKMINGAPGPEFPEGVTWRTDLATADKAKTDAQNAQKVSSATTGGASSALVQNREQLAPGTVASETGSDGVTYGVDANGQRTYKLDTQQQKWVKLPTPMPAEQGELGGQGKPVAAVSNAPDYSGQFKASPDGSITTQAANGKVTTMGGTATDGTVPSVSQGGAATVPAEITTNLARVKQIITAIAEGIRFKSRIGHALLESFDLKLNEDAASDLAELNKIWPSCVNWAKDPANASNPVAKEIETLAPQVTTWVGKAQSNTRIGTGGTASSATDGTSSALNNNNGSGSTSSVPPENAARDAWNKVTGARYKYPAIGPGSRDVPPDTRVADLQKKLGITPVTGIFGEAEKKAVMAIQEKAGLKPVDGIYGPDTIAAFEKDNTLGKLAPGPGDGGGINRAKPPGVEATINGFKYTIFLNKADGYYYIPGETVPRDKDGKNIYKPGSNVPIERTKEAPFPSEWNTGPVGPDGKKVTSTPASNSAAPTTITVRKGDTLSSIAKNSTPPMELADLIKANPGIDPKKLTIGQTLNLPAGTKAGILPADSAPKEAPAIPKITDVPPMPDLPEPPPPKRETGVIGTLTDDPTYQNWLRKNVKNPKADDLYWVNGERYEATLRRGRLTWIKDQPFGNAERNAQLRNYTGPDSGADAFAKEQQKIWSAAQQARIQGKVKESTGFANEELNRILSLVHHR